MGKSVHSTPVGILSCETTSSSTLSARQLGWRAHPICAQSEPHLFHNTAKRGERTIARQQHVCFQCLNPSLLPSPDTALPLHIARCMLHSCALPHYLRSLIVTPEPSHRCGQELHVRGCCGLRTADSDCALPCAD